MRWRRCCGRVVAARLRGRVIEISHAAQAAHLASALSCCDILAAAYWHSLRIDPKRPEDPLRDRFILGDPAECADELQRGVDETGASTLIFRVNWAGMPHEGILRSMRLLGEEVRPRVSAKP